MTDPILSKVTTNAINSSGSNNPSADVSSSLPSTIKSDSLQGIIQNPNPPLTNALENKTSNNYYTDSLISKDTFKNIENTPSTKNASNSGLSQNNSNVCTPICNNPPQIANKTSGESKISSPNSLYSIDSARQKTPFSETQILPENETQIHNLSDQTKDPNINSSKNPSKNYKKSNNSKNTNNSGDKTPISKNSVPEHSDGKEVEALQKKLAPLNTAFISRIPSDAKEETIANALKECGEIADIRIIKDKDGYSKGYGFVNFTTDDALQRAIREGETLLRGLGSGVSRSEHCGVKVFLGNLDSNLRYIDLLRFLLRLGPPPSTLCIKAGFAFVIYPDMSSASEAVAKINDSREELMGRTINAQLSKDSDRALKDGRRGSNAQEDREMLVPSRTLYFRNIPRNFYTKDLTKIFEKYGKIRDSFVSSPDEKQRMKYKTCYGFVTFEEKESAVRALRCEMDREINGHVLRIEFSADRTERRFRERRNEERKDRSRSRESRRSSRRRSDRRDRRRDRSEERRRDRVSRRESSRDYERTRRDGEGYRFREEERGRRRDEDFREKRRSDYGRGHSDGVPLRSRYEGERRDEWEQRRQHGHREQPERFERTPRYNPPGAYPSYGPPPMESQYRRDGMRRPPVETFRHREARHPNSSFSQQMYPPEPIEARRGAVKPREYGASEFAGPYPEYVSSEGTNPNYVPNKRAIPLQEGAAEWNSHPAKIMRADERKFSEGTPMTARQPVTRDPTTGFSDHPPPPQRTHPHNESQPQRGTAQMRYPYYVNVLK